MRAVLTLPGGGGAMESRSLTRSVVVGRDATCDLVLDDAGVSRRHARLDPGDGGWHVTDLGSANGTCVNGTRLDEAFLVGGETLRFGTVEGTFSLTEDELTASVKLRQTLSVTPVRRARPVAAFWAVTAGVLALLGATLWHKGCSTKGRPVRQLLTSGRPSPSRAAPVAIRITSTSHHIPQPPRVRSLPIPRPTFPM